MVLNIVDVLSNISMYCVAKMSTESTESTKLAC